MNPGAERPPMTIRERCVSFARLARALIRERRENPLVEFGRPTRSVARRLKLWGVLFHLFQMSALFLLAPREKRGRLAGIVLFAGVCLQSIPLLSAEARDNNDVMFYTVQKAAVPVMLLMAAGGALWFTLGTGWSLQRLHDRELKGLPRHRLTSEGAMGPDTGEPAGPGHPKEGIGEEAESGDSPQPASERRPS